MKNTRNFLYLLAYHDAKYFKKIYGVIGNYLSVIDSMYGVRKPKSIINIPVFYH
jgi:hypothetical protein